MNKQNFSDIEIEAEKKVKKRAIKKKRTMKVSGVGVKRLQRIIGGEKEQ